MILIHKYLGYWILLNARSLDGKVWISSNNLVVKLNEREDNCLIMIGAIWNNCLCCRMDWKSLNLEDLNEAKGSQSMSNALKMETFCKFKDSMKYQELEASNLS